MAAENNIIVYLAMKIINSIVVSLLITGFFVVGAILKQNSVKLDIYLGAIWVFILSLIVTFSLLHASVKNDNKDYNGHHRSE